MFRQGGKELTVYRFTNLRSTTGQYGSAAGIRTSEGTGAAAWNTANSQGAIAKTKSGDIYAGNGDTVYKKDSDGNWSRNSGSGWESVEHTQPQGGSRQPRTQPQASTYQQQRPAAASGSGAWSLQRQSMDSQAQARQWGNQQAAKGPTITYRTYRKLISWRKTTPSQL